MARHVPAADDHRADDEAADDQLAASCGTRGSRTRTRRAPARRRAAARVARAAPTPAAMASAGRSDVLRADVDSADGSSPFARHRREHALQRHVRGRPRGTPARPRDFRLPAPARISVLLPQPDASVMPKPNRKPPTRCDSHGTCAGRVDRLRHVDQAGRLQRARCRRSRRRSPAATCASAASRRSSRCR